MLSLRYIIKGQSKELGLEDRFWKRKSCVTARKNWALKIKVWDRCVLVRALSLSSFNWFNYNETKEVGGSLN